jgi:hypothetical protein
VSMQEPSYAKGLAAIALAAADSRKRHLGDPAAVDVAIGYRDVIRPSREKLV